MNDIYIAIAVTLLGLVLSALYSGLETGLYTINKIRLDVRASDGLASAKRLLTLVNQPTRMLAVLLVCNNVASYVASYGVASLLEKTELGPWTVIIVNALVLIPILFIFGYTADIFSDRTPTQFELNELDELDHHVTGQQLCIGLRDFAISRFGLLAQVVLQHWGINRTEDFGAIVFRMVELELLRTCPQDSESDFRSVFQFDEAFHACELAECIGANQ